MLYHIITEDLILENNQLWIIDTFVKELKDFSELTFTETMETADIVWIIGYNIKAVEHLLNLKKKPYVITTIHHIDAENNDSVLDFIKMVDPITNHYHAICNIVKNDLEKYTNKPIRVQNFWINNHVYRQLENKSFLREKWNLSQDAYIIGSFQRDTNGKSKSLKPKLSKGPDILMHILKDIYKNNKALIVLLTGRRRNYIISELIKAKIPYVYHEMVSLEELNELYNCLDLYIVSARVEGGPRAIIECGANRTNIISTRVGISENILHPDSIYDMNEPDTYKNAKCHTEYAYEKSTQYFIEPYLRTFIQNVLTI